MSKICYGCMNPISESENICPRCGFDQSSRQSMPFLPLGSLLQEERYLIGKKLSSNNESTKYLAYDKRSESAVIVREFLPNGLCARSKENNKLRVHSEKAAGYKRLLSKFLEYNRTLVRLKQCSAVTNILDIFRENNTAYVVEEREDLTSFTEYMKRNGGRLEWDDARPLFMPLLSTLETMHKNGISHYGVGPSNIKITSDGKIRLQNFTIADMRKVGTDLRPMLISGCSAPEQYDKHSVLDESTEIYGFTASLFYALTGSVPDDVEKRKADHRLLINSSVNKRLPPHVRAALAGGLQMEPEKRTQNFEDLKAQLSAAPTVKAIQDEIARPDVDDDDENIPAKKKKKSGNSYVYGVISCILSLVLFVIIGTYWLQGNPFASLFEPENTSSDSDAEIKGETVTVPNMVGVKYQQAIEEADKTSDYWWRRYR